MGQGLTGPSVLRPQFAGSRCLGVRGELAFPTVPALGWTRPCTGMGQRRLSERRPIRRNRRQPADGSHDTKGIRAGNAARC